jgi:hypothetical protein
MIACGKLLASSIGQKVEHLISSVVFAVGQCVGYRNIHTLSLP